MAGPDHLVYLPAYATKDERLAGDLAALLRISRVDAKMILAARTPRRVGSFLRRDDAQAFQQELRAIGLRGFPVDREEFAAAPFVVRARGLERRDDALVFRPVEIAGPMPELRSNEMILPRSAVRVIVLGQFLRSRERVLVRGDEVVEQLTSEGEAFLHLYWESGAGCLELRHSTFDYGCLPAKSISGARNFSDVSDGVRRFYRDAVFDDMLLRHPADAEIVTAPIPVEWNVGTTFSGLVSYAKSASNEPVAMCASRIVAKAARG